MKKLFGILNLLICLELIVGPNFPGLRVFTSSVAKAETCPAGLVFDSVLNRCITSDQQAELMNASASCNGDKECYKKIAEDKFKQAEEEGKIAEAVKNKGGLIGTAAKVGAIAAPLSAVMGMFMLQKCANASGFAMVGGGIAFTLGNIMADKKHKKCLKKIRDDWEKNKAATTEKTSSGLTKVSMSQDQSEAFEMLAKSEECMQSSAKMKSGFYAASAVAFAAAAVLALLPNPSEETPCAPQATDAQNPYVNDYKIVAQTLYNIEQSSSLESLFVNAKALDNIEKKSCASVDEFEILRENFKVTAPTDTQILLAYLKDAYQGLKGELVIIQDAQATFTPTGIIASLNSRTGRAITGGVMAGLSAMMWMHANKQAKVAKNRAEFLRKLKQEFEDSVGAISCTQEERNLPANANCYCYTESGQRNSARGNSQICQQLWATNGPAKPGDFNSLDFSNQKVCVSSSGQADENCACKQTRSCLNAIPGMSGNLGLGAISVATNGMKPVNDLVNGNIGAGSINGAAALQGAARLLDEKAKLEKKNKIDPAKSAKKAKEIMNALTTAGASMPQMAESGSPFPSNMSPTDAAKALERELNGARSFEAISGSPAVAQPGAKGLDDDGFKFENPEMPAAATDADKLAEVMKDDFNYANNDITASDSNLFQILTNRYQRSGMRRLFDEEGKAAPEPASKSDISQ